jgi:hypothetical protein
LPPGFVDARDESPGMGGLCLPQLPSKAPTKTQLTIDFLILLGISVTQLGVSHLAPRWLWPLFFVMGIAFFFAAGVFLILEHRRPKLQLKKPLPKPEIFLNLSKHQN